jgi:hypothetical protein
MSVKLMQTVEIISEIVYNMPISRFFGRVRNTIFGDNLIPVEFWFQYLNAALLAVLI